MCVELPGPVLCKCRKGKFGHAAHFTLRCGCQATDGSYQLPLVALVCNFGGSNDSSDPLSTTLSHSQARLTHTSSVNQQTDMHSCSHRAAAAVKAAGAAAVCRLATKPRCSMASQCLCHLLHCSMQEFIWLHLAGHWLCSVRVGADCAMQHAGGDAVARVWARAQFPALPYSPAAHVRCAPTSQSKLNQQQLTPSMCFQGGLCGAAVCSLCASLVV